MNNINLSVSESEIYNSLINKLENIKENLNKIQNYSENIDNTKTIKYIEKLNKLSQDINNIEAISLDIVDEYILQTSYDELTNEDKIKQKHIKISKQIDKIFMPYILYMQIILLNNL